MAMLRFIGQPIYDFFFGLTGSNDVAGAATWIVLAAAVFLLFFLLWRLFLRKRGVTASHAAVTETGASASGLTPQAMEELERAQALLKQEAITPLEYERMKAKILKI